MITFLSLFLGLVTGAQQVELDVGPRVAAVEIRLDGAVVERIEDGPADGPWTAVVDLGPELAPHRLEAIAHDEDGSRLGRVVQRINLPRQPAEARLRVEHPEEGPAVARLSWESIVGRTPESIRVLFDGEELEVDDPGHIELPSHDPERFHFLRAELAFAENIVSTAEASFGGGELGESISTELTALPLAPARGDLPTDPEALADLLRGPTGEELTVMAVEEGPAEVVIVPERGVRAGLIALWPGGRVDRGRRAQLMAALRKDQRARFLWPVTRRQESRGLVYDLFPPSGTFTHDDGGIFWYLTQGSYNLPGKAQRVADAVAVAGNLAAVANHRRAVLLMLSGPEDDASVHHPLAVRRYLARLRVPLYVWRIPPANEEPVPDESQWAEGEQVDSLRSLMRAAGRLSKGVERQRIAWVAGTHLPQQLGVAPETASVRTAGASVESLPEPPPPEEPPAGPERRAARSGSPFVGGDAGGPGSDSELLGELAAQIERETTEAVEGEDAPRSREEVPPEAAGSVRVEAGTMLRTAPEPGGAGVSVVDDDGELAVLERREGWVKVRYRSLTGWLQLGGEGEDGHIPARFDAERAQGRVGRARRLMGEAARELSLGQWTLLTEVDDGDLVGRLRAVAGGVREGYRERFGLDPGPPLPGSPDTVLLFADREGFRRHSGVEGQIAELGLVAHAGGGVAALFAGDRREPELVGLLVHELVHLLNRRTFPGELPPWLEEGMADELALSRVGPDGTIDLGSLRGRKRSTTTGLRRSERGVEVTRRVELAGGRAALGRLAQALEAGRLPTLDYLLRLSWGEFVAAERRSLHYAHAALFLRFLLEPPRHRALHSYLRSLADGGPPRLGLLLAFLATDLPGLESGFRSWLRATARRLERLP